MEGRRQGRQGSGTCGRLGGQATAGSAPEAALGATAASAQSQLRTAPCTQTVSVARLPKTSVTTGEATKHCGHCPLSWWETKRLSVFRAGFGTFQRSWRCAAKLSDHKVKREPQRQRKQLPHRYQCPQCGDHHKPIILVASRKVR